MTVPPPLLESQLEYEPVLFLFEKYLAPALLYGFTSKEGTLHTRNILLSLFALPSLFFFVPYRCYHQDKDLIMGVAQGVQSDSKGGRKGQYRNPHWWYPMFSYWSC